MEGKPVKVALWCIPRSISTVLTKCLSAIDGLEVYMELFSYAEVARVLYAKETGCSLPVNIDGNEADYEKAVEMCKNVSGIRLFTRRISFAKIKEDLENASSKYVLMKDMAYNLDSVRPHLPKGFKYAFLIREPSRVYSSFRKAMLRTNFETVTGEELDIVRHDTNSIKPLMWYQKQHELWTHIKKNIDSNPVIIDAFDLTSHPGSILQTFCKEVGFPYSNDLLYWQPSLEWPSNFVGAGDNLYHIVEEFYRNAFKSQHFVAPKESGPLPRDVLTDDVIRCIDHAMPFYQEMYEHRIRPH